MAVHQLTVEARRTPFYRETRMRWFAIVVPLLIALAACEGPVGPEGPQGPPGDVGPEGPGGAVRMIATGTIGADSTVVAEFPPGVGSLEDLPTLTCYQSETGVVWIPVTEVLCTLVEMPEGNLAIVLANGTPDWFYYFVVVF